MNRRDEIAQNLLAVQGKITRPDITLIAVTKTYPVSDVEILHELGVRNFGENRNEEGLEKAALVEGRWHFQGEIQSRKLRDIAQWADVIHSLDNASHATKLNSVTGKVIDIFLQLSLDGDPARGGVSALELPALGAHLHTLPNLNLVGVMCVLPLGIEARTGFTEVAKIHHDFQGEFPAAKSLSAGMSGDFEVAIDCGATHIRVGSQILGMRPPHG
jgi:pyridoxal phosphate enzyme (YggS family)